MKRSIPLLLAGFFLLAMGQQNEATAASEDFQMWRDGPESEDVNRDGFVDIVDYQMFLGELEVPDSFGPDPFGIPTNWWTHHNVQLPPDMWVQEGTVSQVSEALDRIFLGQDYILEPDAEIHNFNHWDWWNDPEQFDGRLLSIEELKELEESKEVPDALTLHGLPTVGREILITRIEFGHADHSTLSIEERSGIIHANYLNVGEDDLGREILRTFWGSWDLAFDVGDVYGRPLVDFDGTLLQPEKFPEPGERVVALVQNGVIIRMMANPPARVWPGQEEQQSGPNLNIEDWRIGTIDPEKRLMFWMDRSILVTERTQLFDSFGIPFSLDGLDAMLSPGVILQVEGPHQGQWGHGAEVLEIMEHRDVEWPNRPVTRYMFYSYDAENGIVNTLHPHERFLAIGAPIVDMETNEEVRLEEVEPGTPVRATHQYPGPGENFPFNSVVIHMELNPEVGGGEIYHEWDHHGRVARIEEGFFGSEMVFTGMVVRVDMQAEILDRDGFRINLEDLPSGEQLYLETVPISEIGVVLARRIEVWDHDRQYEMDWNAGIFGAQIDRVEGDMIFMSGNRWPLAGDIAVVDQVGNPMELEDLPEGEFIAARVQSTSTGDFIIGINLIGQDPNFQPFHDDEREFFGFDPHRSQLQFAGPQVRVIAPPRGEILGKHGESISLEDLFQELEFDPQTQLIVTTRTSQTGEEFAIFVRIFNYEIPWEEQVPEHAWVGRVGGFDGELLQLIDGWQPHVAVDAEVIRGDGSPVSLEQVPPGIRIRFRVGDAPQGSQTPFWSVVTQIVVDPQVGPGPGPGPGPTPDGEPGEFEGMVLDIDYGERTLTLDGPQIRLDPFRTEVLDQDRREIDPFDLAEGDMLAINFVPEWPFPRATRILQLDPDLVLQPRPDVITGRLIRYDDFDELLIIEGPTLSVPESAEIRGSGGNRIDLEEVESGDQVRLVVHDGSEGPVVERIKVIGGFEGPIWGGGGLEITSTFPAPGEAGVPTSTVVEVTFNEPVGGLFIDEDFDFGLFPKPPEFSDLDVSRDGRTIIADVLLEEDTVYQLFVASERFGFFTMNFTTGEEMPTGSIVGRLALPPDIPFDVIALEESGVFLIDASVNLDELEDEEDAFVGGAPFEPGGDYHIENLTDGEYFVFGSVVLEFGFDEQIELDAFFDVDGDGEPDPVVVAGGLVDRVDLTILPPEPMVIEGTSPEYGEVEIDLETTIEVSFSDPVRIGPFGLPAIDGIIFPEPLSGKVRREDIEVLEDGYLITFDVELEENTTYSFLVRHAESEEGLALEEPEIVVFTTDSELPVGTVEGRLALPDLLPPDRVIRTPAVVGLIPFRDFDPLNPAIEDFAVAGTLTSDGFYAFDHVPSGRYVVTAAVEVALPSFFRMPTRGLRSDFGAFRHMGPFGQEAPHDFVDVRFFSFSQDFTGQPRDDVRPDIGGVDFMLRPEDVRRSALRVVGVEPDPEALQEAPEVLDLVINFSEPLIVKRDFVELDAFMRPQPLSGPIMEDFDIEEDGKRIIFRDVELEAGTSYRFSVAFARGISGQELGGPFNVSISTAGAEELVLGSVSGSVSVEGDEISEAWVFLYDPEAEGLEIQAGAFVEDDGSFLIEEVVAGDYAAYVEIETVGGRDLLLFYDKDGDGKQDVFAVAEGGTEGIDFAVTVKVEEEPPEGEAVELTLDAELDLDDEEAVDQFKADFAAEVAAALGIDPARIFVVELTAGSVKVVFVIAESEDATEPSASDAAQSLSQLITDDSQALSSLGEVLAIETEAGGIALPSQAGPNAGASVSIDLNASSGDQGLTKMEAEAGEIVELAVYGSNLSDVSGVSVSVSFDTLQMAFKEAVDAGKDETHLLKSNEGAIALFLPARLRKNVAQFGGAILSPTESTAADGEGLLSVLRFQTLDDYTGAKLSLDRVIFSALGGVQDTTKTASTALVTPPINLMAQPKGIFSFDFNSADGDGELFHLGEVEAGQEVSVEVYINDVESLTNYSVKVTYDPELLSYITFAEGTFLASGGGTALGLPPLLTENSVQFGSAILGPSSAVATSGSGLVGKLTFSTAENFTESDLLISLYSTKQFGGEQQEVESSLFARISTEAIGTGGGGSATADFDGSGSVDFTDFFMFADAFGKPDPDLTYDLDGNGSVDFTDFFLFADSFGKQVAKGLVSERLPRKSGRLSLEAVSEEDGLRLQLRGGKTSLRGYGAVVEYDPAVFRLVRVDDAESALRADGMEALLLNREGNGEVLVAGSRTTGAAGVEGLLAELRFEPLVPEAVGLFRIREALVRRTDGRVVQPRELGTVEGRWVPQVFVLQPNFPNPFNPSTTIRYQLPVGSEVSLEIYDVLGQKVRTLVSGKQAAGFHRMVWDSRDDSGRQVAAGAYLYRLRAGDFTQVRKLMLLK